MGGLETQYNDAVNNMIGDQTIELLRILLEALEAVSWPAVGLVFLWYFGEPLKEILRDSDSVRLGGAGIDAQVTRNESQASAFMGAAAASKNPNTVNHPEEVVRQIESFSNSVSNDSTDGVAGSRILWVDDNPSNNLYECRSLDALGIDITTAERTEEALDQLQRQNFDLIISDMGRDEDSRAGYELLQKMREAGDLTPFVIYSSSDSKEHEKEARRKSALGSTNDPHELFELIKKGLTD